MAMPPPLLETTPLPPLSLAMVCVDGTLDGASDERDVGAIVPPSVALSPPAGDAVPFKDGVGGSVELTAAGGEDEPKSGMVGMDDGMSDSLSGS